MADELFRAVPSPALSSSDDPSSADDRRARAASTRFAQLLDGKKASARAHDDASEVGAPVGNAIHGARTTDTQGRAGQNASREAALPAAPNDPTGDLQSRAPRKRGTPTRARDVGDLPNGLGSGAAAGGGTGSRVGAWTGTGAGTRAGAGARADGQQETRSWGAVAAPRPPIPMGKPDNDAAQADDPAAAFGAVATGASREGATPPAMPDGALTAAHTVAHTTAGARLSPYAVRGPAAWRRASGNTGRGAVSGISARIAPDAVNDGEASAFAGPAIYNRVSDHPLPSRLAGLVAAHCGDGMLAGGMEATHAVDAASHVTDETRELSIRLDPAMLPETILTLTVSRTDLSLRFASPLSASRALLSVHTDELASRLTKRTGRPVRIDITD